MNTRPEISCSISFAALIAEDNNRPQTGTELNFIVRHLKSTSTFQVRFPKLDQDYLLPGLGSECPSIEDEKTAGPSLLFAGYPRIYKD